jgi:hypothetical protein
MLDLIKENISWLKDVFTVMFLGIGTFIAILTYRRARATILQPIRTEVIKKQSELLSKLLQILQEKNQSFETGLDYVTLVQMNVILTLKDYGFVFKQDDEVNDKLKTELDGWMPCGKSNILLDVEIIGTFNKRPQAVTAENYGKEKYNKLKEQVVDVDKIYLTKSHHAFVKTITDFRDDPFMPSSIQTTLTNILNDIKINLANFLKNELDAFMIEFSKAYFEKNEAPKFNPLGVYNNFNHSRVHHREAFGKLKSEIRKYLRIDEGW